MSFRAKLKRYLLILEKLQHRPSLEELANHLAENGLARSKRTLQRDLEQVRYEMGVEIAYDRSTNRYQIMEKGTYHDTVVQLLGRSQLLELVDGDGREMQRLRDHVEFDGLGKLSGIAHLGPLLRAVRERRVVQIEHHGDSGAVLAQDHLKPHLLKEYGGRWYLLGVSSGNSVPMSIGLDRIQNLQLTDKRFNGNGTDAVRKYFAPMLGVDDSPGKVVRVLLRFTPISGRSVKSLPVHSSQQVVRDDHVAFDITLDVFPNKELRRWILSYGSSVKVLLPEPLARELVADLSASLELYATSHSGTNGQPGPK